MEQTIIFTDTIGVDDQYKPQPSLALIPDWYKKTESYIGGEKKPAGDANTTATVKRCMPVFDAFTSGYILITNVDIYVSKKENPEGKTEDWYEWANQGAITFHSREQIPLHPKVTTTAVPKWINPWGIKTPRGYSTLFVPPFHRESPFSALPAIVDTDKYNPPVNIPFVLTDPKFEGLIPAGTPIVQVIPFKRDGWVSKFGTEKDFKEQLSLTSKLRSRFFDSYKNQFRSSKEYK